MSWVSVHRERWGRRSYRVRVLLDRRGCAQGQRQDPGADRLGRPRLRAIVQGAAYLPIEWNTVVEFALDPSEDGAAGEHHVRDIVARQISPAPPHSPSMSLPVSSLNDMVLQKNQYPDG